MGGRGDGASRLLHRARQRLRHHLVEQGRQQQGRLARRGCPADDEAGSVAAQRGAEASWLVKPAMRRQASVRLFSSTTKETRQCPSALRPKGVASSTATPVV